jgi:hypothetical protein
MKIEQALAFAEAIIVTKDGYTSFHNSATAWCGMFNTPFGSDISKILNLNEHTEKSAIHRMRNLSRLLVEIGLTIGTHLEEK